MGRLNHLPSEGTEDDQRIRLTDCGEDMRVGRVHGQAIQVPRLPMHQHLGGVVHLP